MGNAGSNPAFGGTYRGIVPAGMVRRGLRCFARSICVVVDGADFVCSPAFPFLRRCRPPARCRAPWCFMPVVKRSVTSLITGSEGSNPSWTAQASRSSVGEHVKPARASQPRLFPGASFTRTGEGGGDGVCYFVWLERRASGVAGSNPAVQRRPFPANCFRTRSVVKIAVTSSVTREVVGSNPTRCSMHL